MVLDRLGSDSTGPAEEVNPKAIVRHALNAWNEIFPGQGEADDDLVTEIARGHLYVVGNM